MHSARSARFGTIFNRFFSRLPFFPYFGHTFNLVNPGSAHFSYRCDKAIYHASARNFREILCAIFFAKRQNGTSAFTIASFFYGASQKDESFFFTERPLSSLPPPPLSSSLCATDFYFLHVLLNLLCYAYGFHHSPESSWCSQAAAKRSTVKPAALRAAVQRG